MITIYEEWQNFEIVGFNSCAGWAHFPYFFDYCVRQGTIFSYLIKFLIKVLKTPSSKTFPVGTRSKTSFSTSSTAVDTQQMLKIQSRLVVKAKIIKSLSACKIFQSIYSIFQIICEIHLILESHLI